MRKIEQTLPPDAVELIDAFTERSRAKGIRNVKKLPIWTSVYMNWLTDHDRTVADVTPLVAEEFQTYLVTLEDEDGLHYASRTVADIVAVADSFHRFLREEGRCAINPFHRMRRVKTEQRLPRNIPNPAEMAVLLGILRRFWDKQNLRDQRALYRLHVVSELLYATGMRMSELIALEVKDIDWDAHTVRIRCGKGGVEREAFMGEYCARVLRVYVDEMRGVVLWVDSSTLFGGTGIGQFNHSLNTLMKKTLGFTSHAFRHSLGTHLLKAGCDLRFIQLILGHEDLDSTAVYTRVSKEDLRSQLDTYHPRA